jgi:serine protease Do
MNMEQPNTEQSKDSSTSTVKNVPGAPKRPTPDVTTRQRITAMLLLAILSLSFGFAGGYFGNGAANNNSSQSAEVQRQTISNESELITQIAKEVGDSVVSINVTSQATQDSIFGSRSYNQESAGTGVIINKDGTIITNRHVIPDGASSVSVTLSDGTELDNVEVVGRTNASDPLDIAFLKINDTKGKELKAAKIGDSSTMRTGDKVVAIGNALGQFQNTVTTGIISGYGRSLEASSGDGSGETLQNLFQTDAAINEGNSGGPLVNINGEVIGINTAIASGDAQNIGFAIPINDAKGLITSVEKNGKLLRPYLGVRYVSLNDEYAYRYNLSTKRGAYIAPGSGSSSIVNDSPAQKAGLQEKDVITKVNNDTVDENNSLISLLGKHQVGDKVTLTIVRGSETKTVDVTLEAAPNQ